MINLALSYKEIIQDIWIFKGDYYLNIIRRDAQITSNIKDMLDYLILILSKNFLCD